MLGLISVVGEGNAWSEFELDSSAAVVLGLAPRAVKNAGSAFELDSSAIAVVESVAAIGEVNAWGLVSSVREVNTGSADELFSSNIAAVESVPAVGEVNAGVLVSSV